MKAFKRVALIVLALVLFSGTAEAKILRFGVKAGANFNRLSFSKEIGSDLTDKTNSSGWEAGVMVEGNVPLIGLGFDLSLMYSRMNNNGDIYQNGVQVYDAGKNFLMLPLNVKYKISLPIVGNYLAPYVFTGPNFVFNLDKNLLENVRNKTCQVAWNVGLGLEFFKHLQVGASYNFGLGSIGNSIVNSTLGTNTPQYTVKNNYWMVTAAYLF